MRYTIDQTTQRGLHQNASKQIQPCGKVKPRLDMSKTRPCLPQHMVHLEERRKGHLHSQDGEVQVSPVPIEAATTTQIHSSIPTKANGETGEIPAGGAKVAAWVSAAIRKIFLTI
jgi:hypothetical protein